MTALDWFVAGWLAGMVVPVAILAYIVWRATRSTHQENDE